MITASTLQAHQSVSSDVESEMSALLSWSTVLEIGSIGQRSMEPCRRLPAFFKIRPRRFFRSFWRGLARRLLRERIHP
jgi:hypothetical protein